MCSSYKIKGNRNKDLLETYLPKIFQVLTMVKKCYENQYGCLSNLAKT